MLGNKELLLSGSAAKNINFLAAPSGRVYYRHPSGRGSVMIFNDGCWRAAIIADALFRRGGLALGAYGIVPTGCNPTGWQYNSAGTNKLSGANPGSFAHTQGVSDATLNSLWGSIYDTRTSRQNCDALMQLTSYNNSGITGVPAVEYARSVLFDGIGCDIPNIQLLLRILSDADFIDSLDDTVGSCPGNALGRINPGKYFYMTAFGDSGGNIISSTHADAKQIIYIDDMGCGSLGPWSKAEKTSGTIPVCEVSPPKINVLPVPASFGEVRVTNRGGSGCCETVHFELYLDNVNISASCSNVQARQFWIHYFDAATYDSGFVETPYDTASKKFTMSPAQNCSLGPSILRGANVKRLLTVSFTYQGAQREASVLYHDY